MFLRRLCDVFVSPGITFFDTCENTYPLIITFKNQLQVLHERSQKIAPMRLLSQGCLFDKVLAWKHKFCQKRYSSTDACLFLLWNFKNAYFKHHLRTGAYELTQFHLMAASFTPWLLLSLPPYQFFLEASRFLPKNVLVMDLKEVVNKNQ